LNNQLLAIDDLCRGESSTIWPVNINIAPTILEMSGIPIPAERDGMSLYPQLRNEKS
jgi:hypothetical protein